MVVTSGRAAPPGGTPRTVDWRDGRVRIIDQTALPERLVVVEIATIDELVDAIRRLAVRGAPALGVAGAFGIALAARSSVADLDAAAAALIGARPTAVNLAWGVRRALALRAEGPAAIEAEAMSILEEQVASDRAIGAYGADLLRGAGRVLTHCNAGGLATVERGTALSVVRALHERGDLEEVLVCETRPLLQGARLTAWELARHGVPFRIIVDAAAAGLILGGGVDAVVVGADRIAANGDVANKVGTLAHALAAARAGIPFVVAAPRSTIDPATPSGAAIRIEHRAADEVLRIGGRQVAPAGSGALNPAFDVTPADLVTAVVTERGVVRPPFEGWQ